MKSSLFIQQLSPKIKVENGLLVFKNAKAYKAMLQMLQGMDIEDILEWERSIRFKSLYSCFQNIIEAEWKHSGACHSKEYKYALKNNTIRENSSTYELNIFNPAYAYVLNESALVMIGNDLIQMTADELKICHNTKPLNSFPLPSDPKFSEVEIIPVAFKSQCIDGKGKCWNSTCNQSGGESRFTMVGKYYAEYKNPIIDNIIFIDYIIIATTEILSAERWKIDPWAFIQIRGYSLYKLNFSKQRGEKWKAIYGSYDIAAEGGYRIIMPIEAGLDAADLNSAVHQSIELENAVWRASSKSLADDWLSCSISTL